MTFNNRQKQQKTTKFGVYKPYILTINENQEKSVMC